MQWKQGGDLAKGGEKFETVEHWFDSNEAAYEFAAKEIFLSIGGSSCIYFPEKNRWLVISLEPVKDAVAAGD